jgi:hypothetical protein
MRYRDGSVIRPALLSLGLLSIIAALLHHPAHITAISAGAYLVQSGDTPASTAYQNYGETRLSSRIAAARPPTRDASPALLVGAWPITPPET